MTANGEIKMYSNLNSYYSNTAFSSRVRAARQCRPYCACSCKFLDAQTQTNRRNRTPRLRSHNVQQLTGVVVVGESNFTGEILPLTNMHDA